MSSDDESKQYVKIEGTEEEKKQADQGMLKVDKLVDDMRNLLIGMFFNWSKDIEDDSGPYDHVCKACGMTTMYHMKMPVSYPAPKCLSTPCLKRVIKEGS